jgi:hypothetical protein
VLRALAKAAKDNQSAQNGLLWPWFWPFFQPSTSLWTSKPCYSQSNEIFLSMGIKYWNSGKHCCYLQSNEIFLNMGIKYWNSGQHCYSQSNEIFLNLGIKDWNSRLNACGSKIFTIQCTLQQQFWLKAIKEKKDSMKLRLGANLLLIWVWVPVELRLRPVFTFFWKLVIWVVLKSPWFGICCSFKRIRVGRKCRRGLTLCSVSTENELFMGMRNQSEAGVKRSVWIPRSAPLR